LQHDGHSQYDPAINRFYVLFTGIIVTHSLAKVFEVTTDAVPSEHRTGAPMRTKLVKLCTLFSLCFMLLLPAYASSIPAGTYSLTGVKVDGSPLTGTITFGANGLATSAALVYADAAHGSPTFTHIESTGVKNANTDFVYVSGSTGEVELYYFNTLNAAGGINLCETRGQCAASSSLKFSREYDPSGLTGGSLTPAAMTSVTPEPSTWLLAMTGVVMIAMVMIARRRLGVGIAAGVV
jgi:hypothetical protein